MKHRISIHKSLNVDFCRKSLRGLFKTFIDEYELNPIITNDPILLQQCRTRGYMTIPIAGELRNVICGSSQLHEGEEDVREVAVCPFCNKAFCKRHMAEHLDAPVESGAPRDRELRVMNPDAYLSMPDADLRTEMSGQDNAELDRNKEHSELKRAFDQIDEMIKDV